MAGRSARVRKARVRHAQSMTRLQNEVELQGAYISTYESFSALAAGTKTPGNLKLFRPEQRKQRTGYTAAQRKAYKPYMAMEWYRPEDIIDNKGGATSYRGTSNFHLDRFIRYQARSNRPTKGWFQSIANQYKGRALEAEMGGLSRAKEALASAKSFDPSSVGSSRGWRGGTSSATKEKMKSEATRATNVFDSWTVSNSKKPEPVKPQVSPLLMQFSNKAPTATDLQVQAVSDQQGIITFNPDGTIRSAPADGNVQWGVYGGYSKEQQSQMESLLGDYLMEKGVKKQFDDQLKSEKDIQSKITAKKLEIGYMNLHNEASATLKADALESKKTDLQKRKENEADRAAKTYAELYGFSSKDISSGFGDIKNKNKKKNELELELQGLNIQASGVYKKRLTLGNALSSAGRDSMFRKMYSDGDMSSDTLSRMVAVNTDEDRNRNVDKLALMNTEHNVVKDEIKSTSQLYNKVEKLLNSKSDTTIWKAKKEKLFNELNIDKDHAIKTTQGVLDEVGRQLKSAQTKSDRMQREKRSLSYHIAVTSSGDERLAQAEGQNQNIINKREFESMTGLDLKVNETPEEATARYYKEKGISAPKDQTDWYNTWLIGGGKGMMTSATDINLMDRKVSLDTKLKGQIQGKADILKKYGEWGQATSFIGDSLTEWKGDVSKYYKGKYYEKPSVSSDDVSLAWFGSRTVEGQSFAQIAMGEIGIRHGAGGSSDIGKILDQTQGYRGEIVSHIDTTKKELIEMRKQQEIKQQEHKALRPIIDKKTEASVSGGNIGVDQEFASKLKTSSEALYDINRAVAQKEVTQEHYEQSLIKTDADVELLEKKKKNIEFSIIKGISSSGIVNRTTRKGPLYGYHKMIGLRRRMGGAQQTKQMGGDHNQSLGGLVVSGNTNDSRIKRRGRKYRRREGDV